MTVKVPRWSLMALALLVVFGVGIALGAALTNGGGDDDGDGARAATTESVRPAAERGTTSTGSTAASVTPGGCDELGINSEKLVEGECTEGGTTFVVVNRDSTLQLPELSARLVGIEITDSVGGEYRTEAASGKFATFTLEVKNKLHSPAQFDENQKQAVLVVNENEYTEDFEAENGALESSFLWIGEPIQPEATQTGDVVFDVPNSIARKIETEGNLDILNFSDAEGYGEPTKAIGTIRTYGPGS